MINAPRWPVVGVVAAGGALGAGARYGVTSVWASPWATVAINVAGCLMIGVFLARLGERPLLRSFLTTGVCGGFTTFSAFAVQTLELSGAVMVAYVVATVAGALGGAWAGGWIGRLGGRGADGLASSDGRIGGVRA